ncbi:ATP-binding protein [Roseisolibacter sp. H3M3-2]|uniref:ATP-binding protein n=1 Tax=Roseisolibacter sp. H3M3-2 TaxID=3031323 RepID=UPI0023DA9A3C|nr:ATP-binding protein [Roseisolibacter sp. H3M3-2]MDF1502135.1 ATP-binding protein [Roseisolibacter sp. H3M3-2]
MHPPRPSDAPPPSPLPHDGLSHALFAQSPLSTVVYDATGRLRAANAAFERLFGVRAADLPADYSILEDPQLAAQGLLPDIRRAFAGEAVTLPPVRYEAAADLGVTTSTWTQAYLYPLRDGGAVAAVVLVHLDLTARVDAEEALRGSETRLRLALEAGRMGAWEWVLPERRVRWSETLERIHGLAPGAFGGTPEAYEADIHPHDRGVVSAAVERTLAGHPHELTYRIIRPDGEVRWLSARGQLVRDAHGAPERIVGICTDVTDARRAEEGTRLLAEAGAALAGSLDYEHTLVTVARLAVPALADYCVIDLVDDAAPGGMRRVAGAHVDPAREAAIAAVRRFPPLLTSDGIVARAIRTAAPQTLSPVTDAELVASAAGRAEHLALLRALGPEALLCVPLVARETVIGTMLLASAGSRRRYGPDDLPVATELARRAASAVDNARLHADALRARDAAERSSRDTAGILASISDPFVVYDADWRFRYINAPAHAVFRASGREPGERDLLGARVWDAYPELLGTEFERAMRRAAAARAPATFEEFSPRGATWTEVRCDPMPDGGLAASWRDVTARRQAEESAHYLGEATSILASSLDYEATLASLARLVVPRLADWCAVDLLGEGGAIARVAVAHADPEKVRWAEEIHRRFPPHPDATTGVPNVLRTGRPEVTPEITDAMLAASIADPEYLALIRSVGLRSAMVVPLEAHGRTLGALTLIAAETGRRYGDADVRLALELGRRAALAVDNARLHRVSEEARRQAEAANAAKSQFLSTMSHELRTPLNAIGGYLDLLTLGIRGPLTDDQRQDLERVRRANQHLMSLVTDILNFARVDAGQIEYRLADVELADVIGDLETLIGPQLAAKRIAFDHDACAPDTPDRPHVVRADPEKLRQVLLNLLGNAVKFTEPGGRVTLACATDRAAGVIRVRVGDTGRGIPPDQLERIFEPFVQVDRHRTHESQQGVGLGLAISRELARAMGGDLTVESAPGVGSTFTVTLPAAR